MPVTIQSAGMKYKNSAGNYVSINSIGDPPVGDSYYIDKDLFTNQTTVNSNASSVINAAIASAKASNKNYCVIPAGEYWLTTTIYLDDNVILKGSGMDATTLKIADGCDIDAIRVNKPVNNSGIMDLAIDGNRITNYSTFNNGHHGNAINVWLHYGLIERVRTNWVYKHSLLLNYDTSSNTDDGLGFEQAHQNDVGNLNKVLWCDFRDSLLQAVMWGWRTMDSWMCYTNIGSHAANLYLEGGTSRFIGNHFDGDGDNGAGPEYNVYCGDGCTAMLFSNNIFENTQKENIYFRKPSYSNQTKTITISDNIIRTCSKSTNNTYANIYISGYDSSTKATQIIISGNQILNPDTNANHGYAGIHLDYCDGIKISGNEYFNVGTDNVKLESTCTNVVNDDDLTSVKSALLNKADEPTGTKAEGKFYGFALVDNELVPVWSGIPVASSNNVGGVKIIADYGFGIFSGGDMYIVAANDSLIKAGTNAYRPIVPYREHQATFYGLAKAAGADMASLSSVTVGQYPEAQKVAIQKMLGIYEAPWELIREDTFTNATEANHVITVDGNGNPFELTDVVLMFETPKQETDASKGSYGAISFGYGSSDELIVYTTAWSQAANATAKGVMATIESKDGLVFVQYTAVSNSTDGATLKQSFRTSFSGTTQHIQEIADFAVTSINIRTVTGTGHYKLYGKRKWTT